MIRKTSFSTGAAVGSDGSATITAYSDPIRGHIHAVDVKYNASAPNTTDVALSDTDGSAEAFLTLTNANTDGRFHPRIVIDDPVGSAVAATYDHYVIEGKVKCVVTGANEDDVTSIVIWYQD